MPLRIIHYSPELSALVSARRLRSRPGPSGSQVPSPDRRYGYQRPFLANLNCESPRVTRLRRATAPRPKKLRASAVASRPGPHCWSNVSSPASPPLVTRAPDAAASEAEIRRPDEPAPPSPARRGAGTGPRESSPDERGPRRVTTRGNSTHFPRPTRGNERRHRQPNYAVRQLQAQARLTTQLLRR